MYFRNMVGLGSREMCLETEVGTVRAWIVRMMGAHDK